MSRAKVVQKIYVELRSASGLRARSSDLVRAASAIENTFHSTVRDRPVEAASSASYRTEGVPFEQWSLDRAMADGGWRILRYESELARAVYEDESPAETFAVNAWLKEQAA